MPDLSFGLYSGYLPVAGSSKQLHYVAALSQNNWKTDPVIIWFNGGPGCSSMLGWLQEHGPYSLADGTTTFAKNQYSWNKEATVVYIESPAGVGYSICTDAKEDCTHYNDFNTADDAMQAFEQLMTDKFPELQPNDLYISGESYAGIYVPRLVERIDWYIGNCTANKSCPFIPNLKGFMVGNGVTDYRYDNQKAFIDMAFWYGMIATELWDDLTANQCWLDTPPAQCNDWLDWLEGNVTNINVYDVFGKCWPSQAPAAGSSEPEMYKGFAKFLQTPSDNQKKSFKNFFTANEYTSFINRRKSQEEEGKVGLVPPCTYSAPLIEYMNNASVRTALHIPASAPVWELCNGPINGNYTKYANGSIEVYVALRGKYKMLKYSGDTDMAVPTYGTKGWIDNLNWPITKEWKQFFVDGQVGGYSEYHDDGKFIFTTIHGAGHMAPQWRPAPTYYAVFNFIKNKPI
ncbi:hypothetical protein FGO68_gene8756 [Halteria grandinella]|uniref:Carboxypeptidase n=1 Tax=Halteria grandinella TaxID=5974 RepID=A0A8J8NPP4_HALGN|nr:hypothetical protein FGO68_gene8756 [Halteria grandinella]